MSEFDGSREEQLHSRQDEPESTGEAGVLPPGPDGWPLVGNTVQFVRDPFEFYDELASYGDVVRYAIAGQTWVTVLHPEHVERVLVEDSHRFERYSPGQELGANFAPNGLLMTTGDRWRRQRRLIQPAFSPAAVAAIADDLVARVGETVDSWRDGETIAANREFADLTLDLLTRTLFDLDLDDRRHAITAAANEIAERGDSRSLLALLPLWIPTPRNRRFERRMTRFEAAVTELLEERRADDAPRDDLLSALLEATDEDGNSLSNEELRDQLLTFLFAGHETSSLALTYAFLLLAQHEDVRTRLESELDEVCGDREPTMADLPELGYTERVVDETLRLYPPAYVLFRKTTEAVTIDGYRIPEGTAISVPQFRLHTDDRFWDDPERFRPERWSDDAAADRPEYAYFPFGGGPRHCVAMRFATLELKLALATIAQRVRFDLESDPDPELRAAVTLSPAADVELTVRKRS